VEDSKLRSSAPAGPSVKPESACPPAELIRAIHAGSFFLQHGTKAEAKPHIDKARRELADQSGVSKAHALIGQLEKAHAASTADDVHLGAEAIRLELSRWTCLTEKLHNELHQDLPPIP
jgi:hypothetical protein